MAIAFLLRSTKEIPRRPDFKHIHRDAPKLSIEVISNIVASIIAAQHEADASDPFAFRGYLTKSHVTVFE
ncbi:hypothetical protein ACVWW4_001962 [Bradyrhizobium sp. LB7.1]